MGLRANQGNKGFSGKYAVTGEENSPVKTTAQIAEEAGISERVAQQEKQIAAGLADEVKEKVKELDMTKSEALQLARVDKDKQNGIT